MEANATCCLLLTIQQGFDQSRCICQKRYVIRVVHVRNSLCGVSSASYLGVFLKLVHKFNFFGSSVSSTENDFNMRLVKACTAIDRLSFMWKSELSDNAIFSKQRSCPFSYMDTQYGRWLSVERKGLKAIAQECYELYWTNPGSSLPQNSSCTATYHPFSKTIQIRRTRYVGHCWRSKDELMSDIFPWTPSHGWTGVGRPAGTYQQLLCTDTGSNGW